MKRSRAALNETSLNAYFNELYKSVEGIPPKNMINHDETNLIDDPGKQIVIVRSRVKHASRVMDFSKTSVMFCVVGGGTLLPPYIAYKAKNLYPEWIQNGRNGDMSS